MELSFDGWSTEKKKNIRKEDIYLEEDVQYSARLVCFYSGFPPVKGEDEEDFEFTFDTVATYLYIDENASEVGERNYVPWFDGEEVRNVDIPQHIIEAINIEIANNPPLKK